MNMSTWAIRQPVPTLALFLVLCLIGLVSFGRLPVTQFPNIDIPIITINVGQPGAAPAELVSQVTKPIEDAVSSVVGVKHVNSSASDSSTNITVEFNLEADPTEALNDIKDAVAGIRGSLPGAITEPIIRTLDVTGQAILTYAVSNPNASIETISYFVDDVIASELQASSSVGKVTRIGGAEREIKVDLDPSRLLALGITASDVSNQLRSSNIDLGGGRGTLGGQEFSIRALGSADTLEQLAATPLSLSNGRTVRLDDLGEVKEGAVEVRNFAMNDGKTVVAFGVYRATGKSDLTASASTKAKLANILKKHPEYKVALIDDMTKYTEGSFNSAMTTLYEGALLAIIVVLIFLKDWRATVITAVALPLSIIPTFFVMDLLGFSLNTISLLGITLVTGILVDDAIVEIENIMQHIDMGKPAYEASNDAASEIGMTVIAISFCIVAVFAPVSFMSGIAGQYFKQFGLTVAIAVLFSLLVARLITPMMAAYFMKNKPHVVEQKDGIIMRVYQSILRWTLRNRTITLILGLVVFVVSLYSATLLPSEFIPKEDMGRSSVSFELPPGSTLSDTRQLAKDITAKISAIDAVDRVFVNGDIGKANFTINYVDKAERERSSSELQLHLQEVLQDTPDVRMIYKNDNGQRDVMLSVLGDDPDQLKAAADEFVEQMKGLSEVKNVTQSASLVRPEIQITPKSGIATEMGVSLSTLASTIRVATIGDSSVNLAKYNDGERQIPINVRMNSSVRDDLLQMANIRIPRAGGEPIPLGVIADIGFSNGPTTISRYDRQQLVTVEADLATDVPLGDATKAVAELSISKNMPTGTSMKSAGDAEVMGEIFASFGLAMGAGILLVYIVLVLLFSSFIAPITILVSMPLAIGGAIFALFITNKAIGLSVVIGFLMLMGIVTKNAIMLVEFATEAIKKGVDRDVAMLDAGHKRARPIVMTTIAMVAGMVPSALALGDGGAFRSPMAISVIGGLILSTVLSLLFVPSVFSVMEGLKNKARRVLVALGANQPTKESD